MSTSPLSTTREGPSSVILCRMLLATEIDILPPSLSYPIAAAPNDHHHRQSQGGQNARHGKKRGEEKRRGGGSRLWHSLLSTSSVEWTLRRCRRKEESPPRERGLLLLRPGSRHVFHPPSSSPDRTKTAKAGKCLPGLQEWRRRAPGEGNS